MKSFFHHPMTWLFITLLMLAACTYFPIRIKNDILRSFVMRWVLVPVSLVIVLYVYPVGIEVFRSLAVNF